MSILFQWSCEVDYHYGPNKSQAYIVDHGDEGIFLEYEYGGFAPIMHVIKLADFDKYGIKYERLIGDTIKVSSCRYRVYADKIGSVHIWHMKRDNNCPDELSRLVTDMPEIQPLFKTVTYIKGVTDETLFYLV